MGDLRCWQIDGHFGVEAPHSAQGRINRIWPAGCCNHPQMALRACGSKSSLRGATHAPRHKARQCPL